MKWRYNLQLMEDKFFKILSIDGGGIRGVLPAAYLNYVQERIDAPIYKYFDMIVGTSTGGIIALALALEVPTEKILNLYKTKGKKIFSYSLWTFLNGFFTPKYKNTNLINELKEIFGENTALGEAKTRICIPSVDITNGKAVVFKTRHHPEYVNDYKIEAWKIGAATSAAPIYFPAFFTATSGYVDGGIWANNPSIVGIAEAYKLNYKPDRIKMLSLGTGSMNLHRNKLLAKFFGLIGWRTSLIDLTFEAQSQGISNVAKYLCNHNYERINRDLPCMNSLLGKFDLDNTNRTSELEGFAEFLGRNTFENIKNKFFDKEVEPFIPIPEERKK